MITEVLLLDSQNILDLRNIKKIFIKLEIFYLLIYINYVELNTRDLQFKNSSDTVIEKQQNYNNGTTSLTELTPKYITMRRGNENIYNEYFNGNNRKIIIFDINGTLFKYTDEILNSKREGVKKAFAKLKKAVVDR